MKKIYLDQFDCVRILKNVYIFGVCRESDEIVKLIGNDINIIGFVDNYKYGENNTYLGKNIFSVEEYIKKREFIPILIATARYQKNIRNQLERYGLKSGEDIFVWDNSNLHHSNKIIDDLCIFLAKNFADCKYNGEKKVLISLDNCHDQGPIINAFLGNYLAKQYNAHIVAYCRYGFDVHNISSTIRNIYYSFNTEEIIDYYLDDNMRIEAERLTLQIWSTLYSWDDWKKIEIYGIHFGTTIIRDFFRRFMPQEDIRNVYME